MSETLAVSSETVWTRFVLEGSRPGRDTEGKRACDAAFTIVSAAAAAALSMSVSCLASAIACAHQGVSYLPAHNSLQWPTVAALNYRGITYSVRPVVATLAGVLHIARPKTLPRLIHIKQSQS